jgi:hypothetical protein
MLPIVPKSWLRALLVPLLCAIPVSTGPAAQDAPLVPPEYPDGRTIRPIFGTITVTLAAQGTIKEAENTTTTVSVKAQKIIDYTPEGSTTRLWATGRATAVTVHPGPPRTTEKEETTYGLDPDDRERRSPAGTDPGLDLIASLERQSAYFSIELWTFGVQSHTTFTNSEGGTLTSDSAFTWHIRVPNHTRDSAALEAVGDDAVVLGGTVEVPGADGRTTGSYTVPILFGRLTGADTPPMLKKQDLLDDPYPGFVPGTISVTWSLAPTPPDTEAVFELTDTAYDAWRPWPGPDENTAGDTLTFSARIHKRDKPDEPASQRATFKFELMDVTKEPGVCMNWPTARPQPEPQFDLRIEQARNPELRLESTQVARSKDGLESAQVVISSFDGAAWGRLRVTAILDDGTEVPAHFKDDRSRVTLTLPRDDDENHIADVWEKNYGRSESDAAADEDPVPPPREHPGDGFSNFEEYRGFWIQGEFTYTNPNIKDLFIHDAANLGVGLFGVTGLAVHLVKEEEYGQEDGDANHNPNVVNVNRDRATRGAQHLLKMVSESLPGLYGKKTGDTIGPPALAPLVRIDDVKSNRAGARLEFGRTFLDWVIAHELAHGCNVRHHGDSNYRVSEVDGPGGKAPEDALIARIGGQHSGAMDCLMRYISEAKYYELPGGQFSWRAPPLGLIKTGEFYNPDDPGTTLCEAKGAGSDGAEPKVGSATIGECRKHLRVNDNEKQ